MSAVEAVMSEGWLINHEPVRVKRLLVRFKLIDEIEHA